MTVEEKTRSIVTYYYIRLFVIFRYGGRLLVRPLTAFRLRDTGGVSEESADCREKIGGSAKYKQSQFRGPRGAQTMVNTLFCVAMNAAYYILVSGVE